MKSNSDILEVQKLLFLQFQSFEMYKFTKNQNSEPLNLSKMQVFDTLNFQQLISHKICVAENSENFTLCVIEFHVSPNCVKKNKIKNFW